MLLSQKTAVVFWLTRPQAMNTGLFISIIELLTKNTLVQDSILNAANFLFYTLMYLYFLIPLSIYLLMYILLLQDHSLNIFHFEICFLQIYGLTFIFEYNAACISVYIHMQTKFIFIFTGALLISGIYDLRPLVPSSINDPLKMTEYVLHVQFICRL